MDTDKFKNYLKFIESQPKKRPMPPTFSQNQGQFDSSYKPKVKPTMIEAQRTTNTNSASMTNLISGPSLIQPVIVPVAPAPAPLEVVPRFPSSQTQFRSVELPPLCTVLRN